MSHVTHMNESCHTYEWVVSHIFWMSHVTHMNESCHTYEWVMGYTGGHHWQLAHQTLREKEREREREREKGGREREKGGREREKMKRVIYSTDIT